MENIIEKIYNLHVQTSSCPFGIPDKTSMDREWELYHHLYDNLPQAYKQSFLQYIELRSERQSRESQAAYESGFKAAIRLICEALNE